MRQLRAHDGINRINCAQILYIISMEMSTANIDEDKIFFKLEIGLQETFLK